MADSTIVTQRDPVTGKPIGFKGKVTGKPSAAGIRERGAAGLSAYAKRRKMAPPPTTLAAQKKALEEED